MNTRRPPGTLYAPAVAYLGLAIAWTWPLPLYLGTRVAPDPGDPLLVTYLIWWNAHTLPFSHALWNAPFYWPLHDALALTEHGMGLSIISSPIQWLGGSPRLAYNLLMIASTWWCALAAHALVRRLTNSTAAAVTAGLAYALAPYRASQLSHLQMLASWWIPVALLALHEYVRDRRPRWLVLFAVAWLLTALTNGYFLLFVPVLLLAWWIVFTPWRRSARTGVNIGAAFLLGSLPLVPVLLEYWRVQLALGLARSDAENRAFSAHLTSFLQRTPQMALWPGNAPQGEDFLYPGAMAVLLIVIAFALRGWRRVPRRAFFFYTLAALASAWLTMGPADPSMSREILWHPYSWIAWLPGFSGLRVPERFFALTSLCLAVAAGLAVASLGAGNRRRAGIVGIVAACGLVADGWMSPVPISVPPQDLGVGHSDARVIELPFDDDDVNVRAMYRSMSHRMPVVNGYAGYVPPHADVLDWALHRHDETVVTELRRGHPLLMVIAPTPDADEWTRFVESLPGATMIGVTGAGLIYRLPAAPYVDVPNAGPSIPIAGARTADGWLVGDLGAPHVVRFVEIETHGDVVRLPASLAIEASLDGRAWQTVSDERPGGAAFLGALAEPRLVPVRVQVPDVLARYIRVNAPTFHPGALSVYAP